MNDEMMDQLASAQALLGDGVQFMSKGGRVQITHDEEANMRELHVGGKRVGEMSLGNPGAMEFDAAKRMFGDSVFELGREYPKKPSFIENEPRNKEEAEAMLDALAKKHGLEGWNTDREKTGTLYSKKYAELKSLENAQVENWRQGKFETTAERRAADRAADEAIRTSDASAFINEANYLEEMASDFESGMASVKPKVGRIHGIDIDEEYQGFGLGQLLYLEAFDKGGADWYYNSQTFPPATNTLKAMQAKGYIGLHWHGGTPKFNEEGGIHIARITDKGREAYKKMEMVDRSGLLDKIREEDDVSHMTDGGDVNETQDYYASEGRPKSIYPSPELKDFYDLHFFDDAEQERLRRESERLDRSPWLEEINEMATGGDVPQVPVMLEPGEKITPPGDDEEWTVPAPIGKPDSGDVFPAMLEPGTHVTPKDQVKTEQSIPHMASGGDVGTASERFNDDFEAMHSSGLGSRNTMALADAIKKLTETVNKTVAAMEKADRKMPMAAAPAAEGTKVRSTTFDPAKAKERFGKAPGGTGHTSAEGLAAYARSQAARQQAQSS